MGWIANAVLIAGCWLLGKKIRAAFLFTFVGESLWVIESARIERYDMLFLCVVFGGLALRNWFLWRKAD